MNIPNFLIKSQQCMLGLEGLYQGKIDGLWGPKSKAALKAFATDSQKRFGPAQLKPNAGPFTAYEMLPFQYKWHSVASGERIVVPSARGREKFDPTEAIAEVVKYSEQELSYSAAPVQVQSQPQNPGQNPHKGKNQQQNKGQNKNQQQKPNTAEPKPPQPTPQPSTAGGDKK